MTVYSGIARVSAVAMDYWSASAHYPYTTGASPIYRNSGASPHYERPTWYKCPFCGHRQNIDKDGAHCKTCLGDIMDTNVK